MWIWIKFYPCLHRPDARRLCQNYSTIRVDMDKISFIHIHADEVRAVCVKIIDLPIWIWIKFYPCQHRREARRSCQKFTKLGRHRHTIWRFHMHLLWAAGGLHAFHLLYRWRHPPRRPALSPAPFGRHGWRRNGRCPTVELWASSTCDCRWQSCALQFTVYVGARRKFFSLSNDSGAAIALLS